VIVADGMSTDGTREILDMYCDRYPHIRVIDNPDRIQSAGLNEMIRSSRGDVVVRMDVHCLYPRNYVRNCVEALMLTGADNVGGAQRAIAQSRFQRALCAVLKSPLGVGGAKYRSEHEEGYVDTVFLGCFWRVAFEKFGIYDPEAITNEDAELNQRIVCNGGKVYLSKSIVVHYFPRENPFALAKQYFRYGFGRARTLLKHRRLLALRPVAPFAFALSLAALALVPATQNVALGILALYAMTTAGEAVRVGASHGAAIQMLAWPIFAIVHASHALGFAVGLARYGGAMAKGRLLISPSSLQRVQSRAR